MPLRGTYGERITRDRDACIQAGHLSDEGRPAMTDAVCRRGRLAGPALPRLGELAREDEHED